MAALRAAGDKQTLRGINPVWCEHISKPFLSVVLQITVDRPGKLRVLLKKKTAKKTKTAIFLVLTPGNMAAPGRL